MPSVRIKICGVTTPADAEQAARLGADALGLNFYPRSPRYLTAQQARDILAVLPPFVDPVGLLVDAVHDTWQPLNLLGLRTVQLHGDLRLTTNAEEGRFIPAFPVRDADSLRAIDAYLAAQPRPAAILVDAHVAGLHGGTGQVAPWHLLADYRPAVPLILAGGLTPDNVAEAIRIVRPFAVDVASGVESRPGVKDTELMRRFIDAVRSA